MELRSEKEIMDMEGKERRIYLNKLAKFVCEQDGSIPQNVFPEFRAEEVSGFDCPHCGTQKISSKVTINTTKHTPNSWLEHCICKECGKFYSFYNGI